MAENILAAACESESRNAAKRMRLEAYHVSSYITSDNVNHNASFQSGALSPSP